MRSVACISSSVRAACQHTPACFPRKRNRALYSVMGRSCCNIDFASRRVVKQLTCVPGVRFHGTHVNTAVAQPVSAAPLTLVPISGKRGNELNVHQSGRCVSYETAVRSDAHLSPYSPYTKPHSNAAEQVNIQSLFEGDVIPELCSRLADCPNNDRAEHLATLLGACVEFGLDTRSPLVHRLMDESLQLLCKRDIGVAQLCHLGEVAYALEGLPSAMLAEVLNRLGVAVEDDVLSPREVVGVYSLLALCYNPASQRQMLMLSTLHRYTQRLVHQLKAAQVSNILQLLLKFQPKQTISLVLRLSQRASWVFKAFTDDEVIKVLSALMILGQHDEALLFAMEKHLPERLGGCDPELISTVMAYCLQMRCRSKPIFEAVAENFVGHAEEHTTLQIAKQIIAMGSLNYLPQCSSQMFKKLESILSTRFSQFQPRSLVEVLHACIHLERFPLNYVSKVFSPYFLQRLQVEGEPLNRNALGQLTQLYLSTSLECHHYRGPRLPCVLHMKNFSSVDQALETPMDSHLYRWVKRPLAKLLGGKFFYTRIKIQCGYTLDVEICLDESGYVLPLSHWDHTCRRIALFLDGQSRFCSNTPHLLGKEATKRRHVRSMGYEVVQIPYFEFEMLSTGEEQVQYLHSKIFPTILKFHHKS